jgi:hypothetical protein
MTRWPRGRDDCGCLRRSAASQQIPRRHRQIVEILDKRARLRAHDFTRAHKGNSRDGLERPGRIFAERVREFHDGVLAFAVYDDVHEAGLQDLRRDVAEETAAGDDFCAEASGEARQAEAFRATHGFLAQGDDRGTACAKFAFERTPAHFKRRRVEDFHAPVRTMPAQHSRQRGEGERRPERRGRPVERPNRARRADKQKQPVHAGARETRRASQRSRKNKLANSSAASASAPPAQAAAKMPAAAALPSSASSGVSTSAARRPAEFTICDLRSR